MSNSPFTIEHVHKSQIKIGDAIMHNGRDMTVCKKDITRCSFMGLSIFGDNYNSGTKLVQRMHYNNPMKRS